MTQTHQDVLSYRGQELRGSDGEKLGTIEEIYLDTDTRQPEWAVITTGLLGTKQTFVPIGEAGTSGDGMTVPTTRPPSATPPTSTRTASSPTPRSGSSTSTTDVPTTQARTPSGAT